MMEFKLPDVGEGLHDGEIIQWLIKEGDHVNQDQPVVEVQTDKVNAELTAPASGVIKQILFPEGDTVKVGTTIFVLQKEGSEETAPVVSEKSPIPEFKTEEPKIKSRMADSEKPFVLATPFVRQLAREMKIDIERVKGTGSAGRVTEQDVKDWTEKGGDRPSSNETVSKVNETVSNERSGAVANREERIQLKGMRKKIAEHMVKSVAAIPHVTHVEEMEMDALKEMRAQLKPFAEQKQTKLTFLPFFIKAVVVALKEFKELNSSLDEQTSEIVLKNYYHIGIATNTQDGLIVPVIHDADQKTIFEIADEIQLLAQQAREGKLTLNQITGSTFTISNMGGIGSIHATPIINHPEAAILALHKMESRMVVRNMEGVIRSMMNMSLSFDHRLIDGMTAVLFTNRIKELLENPNLLFVEMK